MSEVVWTRGTTPEKVAEAIERAQHDRERSRPAATTAERDAFFAHLAEERKRAEGGS